MFQEGKGTVVFLGSPHAPIVDGETIRVGKTHSGRRSNGGGVWGHKWESGE